MIDKIRGGESIKVKDVVQMLLRALENAEESERTALFFVGPLG